MSFRRWFNKFRNACISDNDNSDEESQPQDRSSTRLALNDYSAFPELNDYSAFPDLEIPEIKLPRTTHKPETVISKYSLILNGLTSLLSSFNGQHDAHAAKLMKLRVRCAALQQTEQVIVHELKNVRESTRLLLLEEQQLHEYQLRIEQVLEMLKADKDLVEKLKLKIENSKAQHHELLGQETFLNIAWSKPNSAKSSVDGGKQTSSTVQKRTPLSRITRRLFPPKRTITGPSEPQMKDVLDIPHQSQPIEDFLRAPPYSVPGPPTLGPAATPAYELEAMPDPLPPLSLFDDFRIYDRFEPAKIDQIQGSGQTPRALRRKPLPTKRVDSVRASWVTAEAHRLNAVESLIDVDGGIDSTSGQQQAVPVPPGQSVTTTWRPVPRPYSLLPSQLRS